MRRATTTTVGPKTPVVSLELEAAFGKAPDYTLPDRREYFIACHLLSIDDSEVRF